MEYHDWEFIDWVVEHYGVQLPELLDDEDSVGEQALQGWDEEDLVKLASYGFQWPSRCYVIVLDFNDIGRLDWLWEQNCPWSEGEEEFPRAVKLNSESRCQWLLQHGCPWSTGCYREAAQNNNTNMLRWLYTNGCPLEADDMVTALYSNNSSIKEWFRKHQCPTSVECYRPVVVSADWEWLYWLRERGTEWDENVTDWARYASQPYVYTWLLQEGCPVKKLAPVPAVPIPEHPGWYLVKQIIVVTQRHGVLMAIGTRTAGGTVVPLTHIYEISAMNLGLGVGPLSEETD
jgi:hypothetical protein